MKIKLEKFKGNFKKIFRRLAENALLSSLVLILFAFILGVLLLYHYTFLIKEKKLEVLEKISSFDEKSFQEILKVLEERQKKFEQEKF